MNLKFIIILTLLLQLVQFQANAADDYEDGDDPDDYGEDLEELECGLSLYPVKVPKLKRLKSITEPTKAPTFSSYQDPPSKSRKKAARGKNRSGLLLELLDILSHPIDWNAVDEELDKIYGPHPPPTHPPKPKPSPPPSYVPVVVGPPSTYINITTPIIIRQPCCGAGSTKRPKPASTRRPIRPRSTSTRQPPVRSTSTSTSMRPTPKRNEFLVAYPYHVVFKNMSSETDEASFSGVLIENGEILTAASLLWSQAGGTDKRNLEAYLASRYYQPDTFNEIRGICKSDKWEEANENLNNLATLHLTALNDFVKPIVCKPEGLLRNVTEVTILNIIPLDSDEDELYQEDVGAEEDLEEEDVDGDVDGDETGRGLVVNEQDHRKKKRGKLSETSVAPSPPPASVKPSVAPTYDYGDYDLENDYEYYSDPKLPAQGPRRGEIGTSKSAGPPNSRAGSRPSRPGKVFAASEPDVRKIIKIGAQQYYKMQPETFKRIKCSKVDKNLKHQTLKCFKALRSGGLKFNKASYGGGVYAKINGRNVLLGIVIKKLSPDVVLAAAVDSMVRELPFNCPESLDR